MSNETNPPAPEPAGKKKNEKKYEVARTINLGKGDIRTPGSEIKASEVSADDLRALLAAGHLRDSDAPIPPSQAEGVAAFDRLASIAQKVRALRRDGATYQFGERTFQGLVAFRAGVSIAQLEAAIVEAFERR